MKRMNGSIDLYANPEEQMRAVSIGDLGLSELKEIVSRIRENSEKLHRERREVYRSREHFVAQVLLAYGRPFVIDDMVEQYKYAGLSMSREQVGSLFRELVERGYAHEVSKGKYAATDKLTETLRRQGITKEDFATQSSQERVLRIV